MRFSEIITIVIVGVLIGKSINNRVEATAEEEKRRNTPCKFNDGISKEQFELIVKRASKHIKRITNLTVDGSVVYGTVRTNSGLSEWKFKVDFNNYGHVTGEYWISSDNYDSCIPERIAEKIKYMIRFFPEGFEKAKTTPKFKGDVNSNTYNNTKFDSKVQDDTDLEEIRQRKIRVKKIENKIKVCFCLLLIFLLPCPLLVVLFGITETRTFLFFLLFPSVLFLVLIFILNKNKEKLKNIEVGISSFEAIGQKYKKIIERLERNGFTRISANPEYDLEIGEIENENVIRKIKICGEDEFYESSKYPYDTFVEIIYRAVKNIYLPISSSKAKKINVIELETILKNAGFINVSKQAEYDLVKGWITKDGTVEKILINGESKFSENSQYRPDVQIIIIYHTFKKYKE